MVLAIDSRSLDSSEWNVPELPSMQELLMVFGWFTSVPLVIVPRPKSRVGPESQEEPTVAHFGALSVVSYTAVCAPPDELTVKAMVVVWTSEPDVPVTVTFVVPVVAVAEAVKVNVEVAVPFAGGVTGLAEKAAVTPLGSAEKLRVVAELKPFWLATVIVLEAFPPWLTFTALGAAETVNPGVPPPTAKIRSSWSSYAPVLHEDAVPW